MKVLLVFLTVFQLGIPTGKTQNCTPLLDSMTVVKHVRHKKAYVKLSCQSAKFDALTCTWTVALTKRDYTHKGYCKHANGCTRITTTTLVMDDHTRKVKSRSKKTALFPHYE